jgi:hypothetical protein
VRDKLVPIVCVAAPIICFGVKWLLDNYTSYQMSFELLLLNALVTCLGLAILIRPKEEKL